MIRQHLVAGLTAFLCLAGAAGPAAAQDLGNMIQAVKKAQDESTLFGTVEIRSDSLKGLQQWQRVVSAMRNAGPAFNACAQSAANCNTAMLKRWREIVVAAKSLPYEQRLKSVNASFNKWPYKLDMEVYGVREYWATPKEFIVRSGDCEDYSIAKYYALRSVGYSKEELRIVAVRDTIRGYGHAVMAAYVGNDILILDNLSPSVLSHKRFTHYEPQVSMNETTRWAHVTDQRQKQKAIVRSRSQGLSASNLFR